MPEADDPAPAVVPARQRVLAQSASARWERRRGGGALHHISSASGLSSTSFRGTQQQQQQQQQALGADEARRLARQKEIRRRKYHPPLRGSPMMRRPQPPSATPQQPQRALRALAEEGEEAGGESAHSASSRWLSSRERQRAAELHRYSASDLPLTARELTAASETAGGLAQALDSHYRFNRPPLLHRHSVQIGAGLQQQQQREEDPQRRQQGSAGTGKETKGQRLKRLMERSRAPEEADEVETDWILNRELEERLKKLQRTMAKLRIVVPEDDGSEMIAGRLEEVRSMCKQVVRAEYFFSLLPEHLQRLVLLLEETSIEDFTKQRRANWRKIDLFRFAGRMAHIISKASHSRRRYIQPSKDESSAIPSQVSKQKELYKSSSVAVKDNKDYYLCSISKELRNSLITRPEFRTTKDIKQIIWLLRATKAFTHLFPAEMEEMCATYVGYEKYDDGRVLAYQEKAPEKFYYVIGGKINRIRQYKLTLGEVNRSLGFITKAMTTDPEEMENEIPRDSYLVAKGLVEVLVLQKWAYFYLLKSTSGPPLDFLRKIDIFQEFPCELFVHNLDAIDMRYYGPNKMVINDSNRTPWLHIVKSGLVKVVRHQNVYDYYRNKPVVRRAAHKVGEGRKASHAGAMMGLSYRQRQMKENSFTSLPDINPSDSMITGPLGLKRSRTMLPIVSKTAKHEKENSKDTSLPQVDSDRSNGQSDIQVIVEDAEEDKEDDDSPTNGLSKENGFGLKSEENMSFNSNPRLLLSDGLSVPSGKKNTKFKVVEPEDTVGKLPEIKILASRPKINSAPTMHSQHDLNIPLKMEDGSDREFIQRTFLTRERTEMSAVLSGKKRQSQFERPTFVQLDTLRSGDVFGFKNIEKYRPKEEGDTGLDHLGATLASEDVGLTLVSDGAEIIRISKRFFVANAENNTMLKVETLYKDYMSEENAKEQLKDQNTWSDYKALLIGRTITDHSRKLKSQKNASSGTTPLIK